MRNIRKNNQQNSKIDFKNLDKQGKWLLGFGLVFLIIGPAIFVQDIGLLDFTKTGQIGDTIGGITSPIINLVGAALVYMSFRAQIKANEIQHAASIKQFEILIDEMNERKYSAGRDYINNLFNQTIEFWRGIEVHVSNETHTIFHKLYSEIKQKDTRIITIDDYLRDKASLIRKVVMGLNYIIQLYNNIDNSKLVEHDKRIMLDRLTFICVEKLPYLKNYSKLFISYKNTTNISSSAQNILKNYTRVYKIILPIRDKLISNLINDSNLD